MIARTAGCAASLLLMVSGLACAASEESTTTETTPEESDMSASDFHGSIVWIELGTSDPDGVKDFYKALFGFDRITDDRAERPYHMFTKDGKPMAGIFNTNDAPGEMPSAWTLYFGVDSVEAAHAKAIELGGTEMYPPMSMESVNLTMSGIVDPNGAAFSMMEDNGESIPNFPIGWFEYNAKDQQKGSDFYTGLFGWGVETQPMPGGMEGNYTMFKRGGQTFAGNLQMTEEWGDMPSHWTMYFMVEDTDAAVQTALDNGGTNPVPAFDIPTVGRVAVIADPTGANFYIMKPSMG